MDVIVALKNQEFSNCNVDNLLAMKLICEKRLFLNCSHFVHVVVLVLFIAYHTVWSLLVV